MRRTLAALVAVVLCLSLSAGVAAAAHEEPKRDILGFELDAEGGAVVYYVTSYDLSNDSERATYESYADNESRRAAFREDAVAELEAAAETGREATDYEMEIRNASVRTYEQEGYGRIEVRANWHALAFFDERRVIVFEPFRSGYRPDRDVAIHGPEGYRRNRTAPQPVRARKNSVLIDTRTSDFSTFFIEFVDPDAPTATATPSPTDSPTPTPADDGGGGLGLLARALLIALIPAALLVLAIRRQ